MPGIHIIYIMKAPGPIYMDTLVYVGCPIYEPSEGEGEFFVVLSNISLEIRFQHSSFRDRQPKERALHSFTPPK